MKVMTSITETHTVAQHNLGERVSDEAGNEYIYLQYYSSAPASITDGRPIMCSSDYIGDYNQATWGANRVKGVAVTTVAAGEYAWFQTRGIHTALVNEGATCGIGDALIISVTSTGQIGFVAAGTAPTNKVIGWAETAAATAGVATISGMLCL